MIDRLPEHARYEIGMIAQPVARRLDLDHADGCLRLPRAPADGIRGNWQEGQCYLNMEILKEHWRESLKKAA